MVVAVLSAASSLGFPFQNILTQTVSISPRNPKFFLQGMTKILGICTSLEGAVGYPKRCSNMRGYPKRYVFQNGDSQNAVTTAGLASFPGPGQFFSHASRQVGSLSSIAYFPLTTKRTIKKNDQHFMILGSFGASNNEYKVIIY